MSFDLVIRGGTVIDGSGAQPIDADVGMESGRITRIGRIAEKGRDEIDARHCLVSPGFIDAHTHLDAQVHWDPLGTSSCWHGVTSVVMGNCGFTLAPIRQGKQALVVRNLERAEDIPARDMAAGIQWNWETFPEYMAVLGRLPKGINFGSYIGHSALRTWAMGDRAFTDEANEEDIALMQSQLRDAMRAGAIGLSTSRSKAHETSDDKPVASRIATWDEVCRLVGTMGDLGGGIFEITQEEGARVVDAARRAEVFGRMKALALASRIPMTFSVTLNCETRDAWHDQLALLDRCADEGGTMYGQCNTRGSATILLSFLTQLPFDRLPEWKAIRSKSLDEQKRLLRDPSVRQRLVEAARHGDYGRSIGAEAKRPHYDLIQVLDKSTPPYATVAQVAAQRGVDPVEAMIDLSLEADFNRYFIQFGQPIDDRDIVKIMKHPRAIMTFSDAGAHVSQIVDASIQTQLLAFWVRERKAFSLEEGIEMITSRPARAWGFKDRGLLREGMAADVNIIDFDALAPGMPELVHDLPAGGRRLIQRPSGYRATIVAGEVVLREGVHTGALPGKVLKGPIVG